MWSNASFEAHSDRLQDSLKDARCHFARSNCSFHGSWMIDVDIIARKKYPERSAGFILRGVFLGREQDYLHLFYGMGKVFPEAYEPFLNYIPLEERDDLLNAYYNRVMDPNPEVHMAAARSFMRFDTICSTHAPNPAAVETTTQNDKLVLSIMRAFLYYSVNRFFLEPNQILSQMDRISHIPAIIIHGRWDMITLPDMAYSLYKNWANSALWMVSQGGHSSNDPAIAAALAKASDFFANEIK